MKKSKLLKILVFIGVLFSCQSEKTYDQTTIFRFNRADNISSLDPVFAKNQSNIWGVNQIFSGLVQLNDSLEVKPDIAKEWVISNQGKTYTFTIDTTVKFQPHILFGKDSTRTVTAHDFQYSFQRLQNPSVASPGKWVLNNVLNFKAQNDSIFTIELKEAFPPFLGLLTMKYCSVVPKEVVMHYKSDFGRNPVGTGPFRFKFWKENVKLVLRKNNNYYQKDTLGEQLPYLEAVVVSFLPDKQASFLQLLQGKLDVISGLDPSYINELLDEKGALNPKYKDRFQLLRSPYLNTEYLCFYLDNGKEIPKAIRQAINYGFNKKQMVQFLRKNVGVPATGGMIPQGLPGFKKGIGYEYNPKKAKELLEEYSLHNKKFPNIKLVTTSDYIDLCEYIQSEIQKLGLKIQVEVVPKPALRQGKSNGKFPFFRASWIADYPDAENYLSLFYSKNHAPNGPNYSHFKNKKFDKLYLKALKEVDPEKRKRYYTYMDSLVLENTPVVPLFYDEVILTTSKKVHNLKANPINLLNLKNVKKIEKAN